MKIHLHIDRLILEGLPVSSMQGSQIRAAIQKELTQLLATHGLSGELRKGVSVPRMRAGTMQFGPESKPAKLGNSIAQAVHEGIGNPKQQSAGNTRLADRGGVPK